jgi:hypothetical protein
MDQRLRQAHTLQHALGVFPNADTAPLFQTHLLQQLRNAPPSCIAIHTRQRCVEIEHPSAGEVSGETMIFRQVPDGPARL